MVKIGDNVCISQGAMLLCGNHDYKKPTFDLITGPITLEEGVWIGAKSTVCPGVTCRSHAVLSVGSVASKDLDPYGIYRGNPAVKERERKIVS
jgi:putative colanic acid biosynthesis acetyltransferase WcaF